MRYGKANRKKRKLFVVVRDDIQSGDDEFEMTFLYSAPNALYIQFCILIKEIYTLVPD